METKRRHCSILVLAALLCWCTMGLAGIERAPLPGSSVVEIRIEDPQSYWQAAGFVELTPSIRLSVLARTDTRTSIYLKVDPTQSIATDPLGSLSYPPGSEADRVALVAYGDRDQARYTVHDVRGTRWDGSGREYFHVYRAANARPHAPLVGYEWPRDDTEAAREATELLVDLVRRLPLPGGGRSSLHSVRRFERLNRCQSCHWADKPAAVSQAERGPPWATDAGGLYTPRAALQDFAPLSADSFFHDPNAGDPFVRASCASGDAEILGRRRAYFFRCPGGDQPIGLRDFQAALADGDSYTIAVCRSRQYLIGRLDSAGQRRYESALHYCREAGVLQR